MKRLVLVVMYCGSLALASDAQAQHEGHGAPSGKPGTPTKNPHAIAQPNHKKMPMAPGDCSAMEVWDYFTAMCVPLSSDEIQGGMWMAHGNAFLVQTVAEAPRGRNRFAVPNMIMADAGHPAGTKHYLSANLMLTFERWTFPEDGYPELLQIGERNADDEPYIDGQHPHSSPIMGLTISDTIRFGSKKDHFKVFFAPRGQATEGPIAFMHRPTGSVNPDAPLGHHVGQDVSHITSTVVGASLALGPTRIEASTFNGKEPEPAEVDLPIETPDSYAARFIYEFSGDVQAMASAAFVHEPEPHDPDLEKIYRYSGSVYSRHQLGGGLMVHNSFVFGLTNYYDNVSALRSFLDEFWFHSDSKSQFWGRVEYLERTPAELSIFTVADANRTSWVTAATAGYSYEVAKFTDSKIIAGLSATKDFLSGTLRDAYGGDPWSGRVFLQLTGMRMGPIK